MQGPKTGNAEHAMTKYLNIVEFVAETKEKEKLL